MCENQLLASQSHKDAHSSIEGYTGGRRADSRAPDLDCIAGG